jgi:hypothetical protein
MGPSRVAAMGGRRFWDDGREVYDLIMALLDYPETPTCPAFTLSLQTDFEDGGGDSSVFRFVGSDGVAEVGFDGFEIKGPGIASASKEAILKGYNSVVTFSKAQQAAFAAKLAAESTDATSNGTKKRESFQVPDGYDSRLDHLARFFGSVREGKPVLEDATFGYQAAAPALLCNESYRQGKVIGWDPTAMRVTG